MSQSYRRRKNSISTALVATMASSSGSKRVFTMGGIRSKRTVSGRVRSWRRFSPLHFQLRHLLARSRHDLAHAAAHVQYPRPQFGRAQGVRVFGVKVRVPVFEKFRVSFIMAVGLLMAHFDLPFTIYDCRFSPGGPPAAPGLLMVSVSF